MEISTVVRHTKFAAEETRKQILDAAEFCFCETGFSKTTLEMIAVRAGCTRGAIYWYFNEKKDLLRQVIERVPLSLFDELTAIKNGRVSEPVKAMYRCLSRSLIKLQYNVHLRNVIYIVFFCEECPDDIRINFLQKMVDVNNFVKLLCYIFEKVSYIEKYVRKFVVRLWRSCFFLCLRGWCEVAFCNLIINPFSERVA
ncbi:TetR family transcriptional regulator [Escherichia coli]|nr:TetR family transcriptional regulator [Escherichia coli]